MRASRHAVVVALLASACGGSDEHLDPDPDAAIAAIDAAVAIDAAEGTVTVTTRKQCCTGVPGPRADLAVHAVALDGTVHDSAVTGADGTATLDVVDGDTVHVLYPPDQINNRDSELYSVMAVQPGDQLIFGDADWIQRVAVGQLTVSYPPVAGGTVKIDSVYRTLHAPADGSTDIDISQCPVIADLVLEVDSTPRQWGLIRDVALVDGGSATLAAWTSMETLPMSLDAPEVVTQGYLFVAAIVSGMPRRWVELSSPLTGPGPVTATRDWFVGLGDRLLVSSQLGRPSRGVGYQTTSRALPASTTSVAMVETALLPWLGPAVVDDPGEIVWEQTSGAPHDGATVELLWALDNQSGIEFHWYIVAPPDLLGALRFPAVPAAFEAATPPPGHSPLLGSLTYIDIEADDGYAALRARPGWSHRDPHALVVAGDVAGMVRTSHATVRSTALPRGRGHAGQGGAVRNRRLSATSLR